MSTPNTNLDKRRIDVTKVFLIYLSTVGDVERTALACEMDPELVRKLAKSEEWDLKIRQLTLASKGKGLQAGDFERMQNRALNWCQGHRMRQILDEVIAHYANMTPEEIVESMTSRDSKEGVPRVSARFFSDLAKALETVHGLTYAALGDTIPERGAMTSDEKANTAAVHASLIAALNGPGVKQIPSEQLVVEATKAALSIPESVPNCPTIDAEVVPPTERNSPSLPVAEVQARPT